MSKVLSITLYMSELIYDFQNKAFITGRSKGSDEEKPEFASNIKASDDEEDKNQAIRSIQGAYGQLLNVLSEMLYGETEATSSNKLMEEMDIKINLHVPSNFVMGIKDSITSSIHAYIINKALTDWFLMTNKGDAEEYDKLASIALNTLRSSLYKRERPTRKNIE